MNAEHVDPFLGTSPAIRYLREAAREALEDSGPVLIIGEPGTGKEALARWIHGQGPRRRQRFEAARCARTGVRDLERTLFGPELAPGVPRLDAGLLGRVGGGSLFLDELGDLSLHLQARLVWVLEDLELTRRDDDSRGFRLLSSTRHSLDTLVRQRIFRADLRARLTGRVLAVPHLRQRPEDIPDLAERLLEDIHEQLARPRPRLSAAACDALMAHAWPGNLRELRERLEEAAGFCLRGDIQPEHLFPERAGLPLAAPVPVPLAAPASPPMAEPAPGPAAAAAAPPKGGFLSGLLRGLPSAVPSPLRAR